MSAGDDGGFANDRALVRAWKRYPAYKDSGAGWRGARRGVRGIDE
ncbi:hypothetical protein [Methanoculleus sp.]|nr:hypothetical protein [Methanoculleus sp.]